ncbi:MAG: ABC-F family ATP-binding cassette domain-containing protein [bacterium]
MKILLQLDDVNKAYGTQVVLQDLNVTISENQKIGVIGRNGAGKSTLCKIVTGHEEQDSGSLHKSPDLRLAYLEQQDPYNLDETLIAFLVRYTKKEEWQCAKVAARFQLNNGLLGQEISTLSGGFRTRVKLASMLLMEPNFLILDEPTNYLDLKTLILLEEFLKDFRGGFLIVSHDREFLKKTCRQTLEIENGSCTLYPGTVVEYLMFKEEQDQQTANYNKNILAKKKQLQAFVTRFGAKATKASQARSVIKKIEKLKTIDTDHPLGNVRIKIPQVEKRNLTVFRCQDLAIGYPEQLVAGSIALEFNQGDHVAVLGDNGQGKTTFLRTIAGDLKAKDGHFKWGFGLKVGYYAQHVLSSLNPGNDVYTHLSNIADPSITRQEILNLAGSFLFRGDDVFKKVEVLSGGEKARLCLAGLLLSKSEVLLLDEPTNHLDFETVESLGRALKDFDGTVFFICHDRTFVNMLATQIVEVKNGSVQHYPGDYEEYVYAMETKIHDELSEPKSLKSKPNPKIKPRSPQKPDRSQARQLQAERARINSQIQDVQSLIDNHKKEFEEIHQAFSTDPQSWSLERNLRYEYLEKLIREEEDLWLELTEKADSLKKTG